jgi:hypothetical protein
VLGSDQYTFHLKKILVPQNLLKLCENNILQYRVNSNPLKKNKQLECRIPELNHMNVNLFVDSLFIDIE